MPARDRPGRALRLSRLVIARIVSGRDVSNLAAPVARSSPGLAPHARHGQLAQMPSGRLRRRPSRPPVGIIATRGRERFGK
jgi:hypothetical protein